ncbi:MAG: hypothetical protein ABW220_11580 [Burkholderiaceae bacterium]
MRRWLTVFLLILLPLQLSWAVAATYCQHEKDPAVTHIGHHQHEHPVEAKAAQGDSADASLTPDDGPSAAKGAGSGTGIDLDCGTCHLGHAQPVFTDAPRLPALSGPATLAEPVEAWATRGPDRRERPNWRAA